MLEAHHVAGATRGRARGTRRCGCGVQLEGLSRSTGGHFVGKKQDLFILSVVLCFVFSSINPFFVIFYFVLFFFRFVCFSFLTVCFLVVSIVLCF